MFYTHVVLLCPMDILYKLDDVRLPLKTGIKYGISVGSYNPYHYGHLELLQYAFNIVRVDVFIICLSSFNARKKLYPMPTRLDIIKNTIPKKNIIIVSNTIYEIIEMLNSANHLNIFIGSDSVFFLKKILNESIRWYVFNRPYDSLSDMDIKHIKNTKNIVRPNMTFVDPKLQVSATFIKSTHFTTHYDGNLCLSPENLKYIFKYNMFDCMNSLLGFTAYDNIKYKNTSGMSTEQVLLVQLVQQQELLIQLERNLQFRLLYQLFRWRAYDKLGKCDE